MAALFSKVVLDEYSNLSRYEIEAKRTCISKITEFNNKLNKARELLLLSDIDPLDYKIIKKDCEDKITRLEADLQDMPVIAAPKKDLPEIVKKAIITLQNLDSIYEKADIAKKREMIGSMFPENLCFDGLQHRTGKCNEAMSLIYLINNKLNGEKKWGKAIFFDLAP